MKPYMSFGGMKKRPVKKPAKKKPVTYMIRVWGQPRKGFRVQVEDSLHRIPRTHPWIHDNPELSKGGFKTRKPAERYAKSLFEKFATGNNEVIFETPNLVTAGYTFKLRYKRGKFSLTQTEERKGKKPLRFFGKRVSRAEVDKKLRGLV